MKKHTLIPVSSFLVVSLVLGCSPDEPTRPSAAPKTVRSALLEAPNVLLQAEAGTLGRGEQDFLVRFERRLPGFGGLFIRRGQVNVYLKGSSVSESAVRSALVTAYRAHPNPLVRQALAGVSQAKILPATYTLSELIAIEQRIGSTSGLPKGFNGAGVAIQDNRVRVTFADSTALLRAASTLEANGIPPNALSLAVTGPAHLEATWGDAWRPTGGGIEIAISNDTRVPGIWHNGQYFIYYDVGSLGYNVQTSSGVNYFLTASHIANMFSATNGVLGDTIFQPQVGARSYYPPVGTITVNPAWNTGAACPINPQTRTNFDFCTTADAMLGTYLPGVSFARKVGTSVKGGINGSAGSSAVNGFYNVTGIFSPEYVDDTLHQGTNRSGRTTGTVSGEITTQMGFVDLNICWPSTNFCPSKKWLRLQNVTEVHAASGRGDSGGPVFSASPYHALGIDVAGEGAGDPCTGSNCYYLFARWDQIEPRLGLGPLNPKTTIP